MTESRHLARLAAQAASSKQGQDIVVLDVSELIGITDYFVIVSGTNERQIATIAEEVQHQLKPEGARPARREGESGARWLLLDFVDFVVHVFHEEERDYYRLENLWHDAPVLQWDEPGADGADRAGAEASSG